MAGADASTGVKVARSGREPSARLQKARAAVDALAVVAGASAVTPWVTVRPLPDVDYPKVFVVGCPRSGTTWVAQSLARHPRAVGGRESHAYPTVHAAGLAQAALAERADTAHTCRRLVRGIFDAYYLRAGGTGDEVLVEKTPRHIGWAEEILTDFPDARMVEVVRDGRDVCVSWDVQAARVAWFQATRRRQIEVWVESVRAGEALRADPRFAVRVTRVRYEDLKADPVGELGRLYDATGLESDPAVVRDVVEGTAISNFPTGERQFRFRGEVGTWRERLSPEDLELFRELAGDLFEQAGYSYG